MKLFGRLRQTIVSNTPMEVRRTVIVLMPCAPGISSSSVESNAPKMARRLCKHASVMWGTAPKCVCECERARERVCVMLKSAHSVIALLPSLLTYCSHTTKPLKQRIRIHDYPTQNPNPKHLKP